MFHGNITAAALADQLSARFQQRHYQVAIQNGNGTALVQIGSQHGTPLTVHIADTTGGVLVTMSNAQDWLDKAGDVSELLERATRQGGFALLAMIPDVIAEFGKENVQPAVWDAINDICALTRSLSGEQNAPRNPKVCLYCRTSNPPDAVQCLACGAALPVDLPRICPKCARAHTSDALFCQSCGTRLVEG
jgi:ribosomal protein L40E